MVSKKAEYKQLFNNRLVEDELDKFSLLEIANQEQMHQIIENWNKTDLSKFTETGIDGEFFNDFFTIILGYNKQTGPEEIFNIIPKKKVPYHRDLPDASLGFLTTDIISNPDLFSKAIRVVVELKDFNTDLDKKQSRAGSKLTPVEQAFKASNKFEKCKWVLVSNYKEIRLYRQGSELKYERFMLKDLHKENNFKKFVYFLGKENLIGIGSQSLSLIDELYTKNLENPRDITEEFYNNYQKFRIILFNQLFNSNKKLLQEYKYSELNLLEKVQKILDRLIFIAFCRDRGLLPYDFIEKIYNTYGNVWDAYKNAFKSLNEGLSNDITGKEIIHKFNGGLFAEDDFLQHKDLIFPDSVLIQLRDKLLSYNFNSQLNINVLGYIFEQSVSDIDEIKEFFINKKSSEDFKILPFDFKQVFEITSKKKITKTERQRSKKVREAIFYTPANITRFITESAIDRWISLQMNLLLKSHGNLKKPNLKIYEKLFEKLENIKILDPACGSGAFLLQAYDVLVNRGNSLNSQYNKLATTTKKSNIGKEKKWGDIVSYTKRWRKQILQHNLYGVDKNYESVEITKLSLWLKTANKEEELTFLDNHIKKGDSLIEDTSIVGDVAFNWEVEFPSVFPEGFDIIIGNPPYDVLSSKETGLDKIPEQIKYFKSHPYLKHAMYQKTNLYKLFIVKAATLLKENGIFSFIVPMSLMGDKEAYTVRKFLFNGYNFNYFEAFPQKDDANNRVFKDAKLSTCIFQLEKSTKNEKHNFYVRIHPGKEISTPIYKANILDLNDVKRFDDQLLGIPISTKNDWEVINTIINNPFLGKMKDVGVKQFQGEVNETIVNRKDINIITEVDTGYEILRGASIMRYAIRDPSQGGKKWINGPEFLKLMTKSVKAKSYRSQRIGFQRSSPQNNFRRLIAAPIPQNYFCFDTVSFITKESSSVNLDLILILLNSDILEWYFRNKSTSSKINEYQFNQFYIPLFNLNDKIPENIKRSFKKEDFLSIIVEISEIVKTLYETKYPKWIESVLIKLGNKIKNIEQKRPYDLPKRERAFLGKPSIRYQNAINDILFFLYGIDSEQKKHIMSRLDLTYL